LRNFNLNFDWNWVKDRLLAICPPLCTALYLVVWWYYGGSYYDLHAGKPLGEDFSYCWSAATLVLSGEPGAVYDFPRLAAVELAHFGVNPTVPWPYPPTYLLLLVPFALLPYLASLAAWLSTTLAGYLYLVRRIAPHPRVIWFTLAFPGTFLNVFFGQNGFLSAIFLGGGLLLLDRSPWLAGLLLALLTYKPHLAILVPVALIAGRRWRALLAMIAWTAALVLATTLVLGPQVWLAFVHHVPKAMKILESGGLSLKQMMPTVFAAVLLSGAGVLAARVLQAVCMLTAAALVAWVWRREAAPAMRNAVLVLGILLFIPHGYVYDLALLALPLAWLGWDGYTRGWLPGEKTCLLLGWLTPFAAPLLAQATNVQISPLILGALMYLALRRAVQKFPSRGLTPEMMGPGVRTSQPG
jgi:hypothetical protein